MTDVWVGTVYKIRKTWKNEKGNGVSLSETLFWTVRDFREEALEDCKSYAKENGIPYNHISIVFTMPEDL